MEQPSTDKDPNSNSSSSKLQLDLSITVSSASCFLVIFSGGVSIITKASNSINEFLSQDYGISEAYIDDRIQTLFLNGKAVDDSRTAMLHEGAVLALSAAMPGMVGSTFRKGGFFAGMRSQISHTTDSVAHHDRQIRIKLKLFNLIAREIGPTFLEKGVYLEGKTFRDFLQRNSEELKAVSLHIALNDVKSDIAKLLEMNWDNTEIFLHVIAEQNS